MNAVTPSRAQLAYADVQRERLATAQEQEQHRREVKERELASAKPDNTWWQMQVNSVPHLIAVFLNNIESINWGGFVNAKQVPIRAPYRLYVPPVDVVWRVLKPSDDTSDLYISGHGLIVKRMITEIGKPFVAVELDSLTVREQSALINMLRIISKYPLDTLPMD